MNTHPNVQHWARVQLVQGESGAATWDLSSAVPQARVTVGAGDQAAWNVMGPSVAPVHFEFAWDGTSLWIGPISGSLKVDGETISVWRQLVGRSRIEFGQAAMLISTSTSSISVTPSLAQSTREAPPPVPDFQDSPATVVWQPSNQFEDDQKTQMVSPDLVPDTSPPPPPPPKITKDTLPPAKSVGVARPGLGSQQMSLDSANEFLKPMSTRILDVEELGLSADPGVLPQAPSHSLKPMITDVMGADSNNSPFSLPPEGIAISKSENLSNMASDFAKKLPPARTMGLFAVTLLAAIVLLTMGNNSRTTKNQQEAARVVQQSAQAEAKAYADTLRQQAAEAAAMKAKSEQSEADQIAKAAGDAVAAAKKAREEARAVRVSKGEILDEAKIATEEREAAELARAKADRKAVELMARHDYRQALPHYLYLSKRYPEHGVYKSMVKILRSRLACGEGGC